jgi:hypothetical protein
MKPATALAICAVLAPQAYAQQLDFKGIPFGSDSEFVRTELYPSITDWYCAEPSKSPLLADKTCYMGSSTYANRPVTSLRADFYGGKVGSFLMTTKPEDYAAIRATVIAKYGKPAHEANSVLSNAYGAKFQQVETSWILRGGSISMQRYTDTLTEGSLAVRSSEYTAELQRRLSAQPKPKSDI